MIPRIIGLAGPIGAGKGYVADILTSQYGFQSLGFGNLVKQALEKEGEQITRKNLQEKGKQIIEQVGYKGIVDLLLENADTATNYVIDGIRHIEVVNYLRQLYGESFQLVFVNAPREVRFKRAKTRMQYENVSTIGQFRKHEDDPLEKNIMLLKSNASLVISNTGSKKDLEEAIKKFLG